MSNDPSTSSYNTGDPADITRKHRAVEHRRERLKAAVRWLAADVRGRLYLAELVRESGALHRVVASDPHTVMFLDGQRSIGFKVLNDIRSLDDPPTFTALVSSALTGEDHGDDT